MNKKTLKEYRVWKAMKSRCYSPSTTKGNYKKNNIQVCEKWKSSFENFITDMGNCPENFSLDRIDNNKDYSPENCRWVSQEIQANNKGEFNIIITYENKSKTLKEWSKELNIKYSTLYFRVIKKGLPFIEAIKEDPFNKLIQYKGDKKLLKDWCETLNLPYQNMVDRKHKGWSVERMFETPITKIKI